MRFLVLFVLVTLSLSGIAQTRDQVEVDLEGQPLELPDNTQEGDLNSNTQVGGNNTTGSYNSNKTYNGAGSSGMPVNTAISPSLMSNGSEAVLVSQVVCNIKQVCPLVSTCKILSATEDETV